MQDGRRRLRGKSPAPAADVAMTEDHGESADAACPSLALETTQDQSLRLAVPEDEGPSQGPGEATAYPMLVTHTLDESHLKLRCYYIHANCCWRWQTSGRGAVLSKSSRKSPLEALKAWFKRHGDRLVEESKVEVQNAMAILEDHPCTATPPRRGASQLSLPAATPTFPGVSCPCSFVSWDVGAPVPRSLCEDVVRMA